MVFNATFNNIIVISWWEVLLVEETRVSGETTDLSQVTDKLYHIMLHWAHLAMSRIQLWALVVTGTDCTRSYKCNYHTTTMIPPTCHKKLTNFIKWCSIQMLWQVMYLRQQPSRISLTNDMMYMLPHGLKFPGTIASSITKPTGHHRGMQQTVDQSTIFIHTFVKNSLSNLDWFGADA